MSTAIPSPTCFISAPPALGARSLTVRRQEMKFQRGAALCRRGQGGLVPRSRTPECTLSQGGCTWRQPRSGKFHWSQKEGMLGGEIQAGRKTVEALGSAGGGKELVQSGGLCHEVPFLALMDFKKQAIRPGIRKQYSAVLPQPVSVRLLPTPGALWHCQCCPGPGALRAGVGVLPPCFHPPARLCSGVWAHCALQKRGWGGGTRGVAATLSGNKHCSLLSAWLSSKALRRLTSFGTNFSVLISPLLSRISLTLSSFTP